MDLGECAVLFIIKNPRGRGGKWAHDSNKHAHRGGVRQHASRGRHPHPTTHMPGIPVDCVLIYKKILEAGAGCWPTTVCMHIEGGCSRAPVINNLLNLPSMLLPAGVNKHCGRGAGGRASSGGRGGLGIGKTCAACSFLSGKCGGQPVALSARIVQGASRLR